MSDTYIPENIVRDHEDDACAEGTLKGKIDKNCSVSVLEPKVVKLMTADMKKMRGSYKAITTRVTAS